MDELTFELGIRSMAPKATRHTMDVLKQRLLKEMRGEAEAPNREWSGNTKNEIKICFKKTKQLEMILSAAAREPEQPEKVLILISRFRHVKFRLGLLASSVEMEKEQIRILMERVVHYLELLNSVREGKIHLKDSLNEDDFLSNDPSPVLNLSSPDCSDVEEEEAAGAGALPPPRSTGTVPKQVEKQTGNIRTSSPKVDGGEDLSTLLDELNLNNRSLDEDLQRGRNRNNKSGPKIPDKTLPYIPPHARGNTQTTNALGDPAVITTRQTYQRPPQYMERGPRVPDNVNNFNEGGYAPYRNLLPHPMNPPQPIIPPQPIHAIQQRHNYRNPIPNWHLVYSGDGRGLSQLLYFIYPQ